MVLVGILTFTLLIRGSELTLVPDVNNMEAVDAILALQEKNLVPVVEMRYSSKIGDKGKVLNQEPKAGSQLRAGRKVILRVSRGAIIERIENYIGWKLGDLEIHLKSLFSTSGPLISIKQPVIRVFNPAAAGTILEQKPQPDTPLTGPVELQLVVSKGQGEDIRKVDDYVGMPFIDAVHSLAGDGIPFIFTSRKAEKQEKPGTVVSQNPASGETVTQETRVELVVTEPKSVPKGHVFSILQKTLPDYPVLVELKLEAVLPDGAREERFFMQHPGGEIAFPYLEEEGTVLILYVFDKEILRYTVK